jgi:hypothetical protein
VAFAESTELKSSASTKSRRNEWNGLVRLGKETSLCCGKLQEV